MEQPKGIPKLRIKIETNPVPLKRDFTITIRYPKLQLVTGRPTLSRNIKNPLRRMLRVRRSNGTMQYYFWTAPNKGEMVLFAKDVKKIRDLTCEDVKKVFGSIIDTED